MARAELLLAAALALAGCGAEGRTASPARGCAAAVASSGPAPEAAGSIPSARPPGGPSAPASAASPVGEARGGLEGTPALAALREELRAGFDTRLEDAGSYVREAPRRCRRFPEGDLFPFTLPAMAYAGLALSEPDAAEERLARAPALLDAAVESVARKLGTTAAGLERLRSTRRQGCYVGQLALALATYRLAGGDGRYDALRGHLADLLEADLVEARGGPIASFPSSTWTFETTAALAALSLDDRLTGRDRATPLLEAHEEWLEEDGLEAGSGLPIARVGSRGLPLGSARGCDLSWRVALLAHADPGRAEALYGRYVAARWIDRGALAGFAEWPPGAEERPDADSGPVLFGVGGAATALGIAAMLAAGDAERLARMDGLVASGRELLPLLVAGSPLAADAGRAEAEAVRSVTGFLYGDATLFYALSWHAMPGRAPGLP